ncbi:MAG: hypothetical protein WBP16_06735 [Ferruginibacter sp.]
MNIDNKLDLLKQIKAVDAPPFLLTRIRQQIDNLNNVEAPVKWKWAFAVSAVLIMALNISILFTSNDKTVDTDKAAGIETVVSSMNLTNTNQLYNE